MAAGLSTASVGHFPENIEFNIQGKHFSAELWGEDDGHPVIALHGWLDNNQSFRPLAPFLKNVRLLALDMAGHGHSDHRSADASYHIWDDVREVLLIAREMGWQRFTLLGHSRGAIIAALIAGVAPEAVVRLVLVEGLLSQTIPGTEAARQLKKFIDRYLAWDGISKGIQNIETLVSARIKTGFGLSAAAARMLILRNTEKVGEYYYWRTDPRLVMPSPQMMTDISASSFIKEISVPTLVILASDGVGRNPADIIKISESMPNINVMILPGGHHLHMEDEKDLVAGQINNFIGTTEA